MWVYIPYKPYWIFHHLWSQNNNGFFRVFVTIISAMVAFSTGYDIICTKNGRKYFIIVILISAECRILSIRNMYLRRDVLYMHNSLRFWFSGTKYPPYLAFSLYTNGKKLISMQNSESPDVIKCLHGIRVLSTQWIVFGHICLMYGLFPVQNKGSLTMVKLTLFYILFDNKGTIFK